jgi:hypothetical protein
MSLSDIPTSKLEEEIERRRSAAKEVHDAKEADILSKSILEYIRELLDSGEINFHRGFNRWVLTFQTISNVEMRLSIRDDRIIINFDGVYKFVQENDVAYTQKTSNTGMFTHKEGVEISLCDPQYIIAVAEIVRDVSLYRHEELISDAREGLKHFEEAKENDQKWCDAIIEKAEWKHLEDSAKKYVQHKKFKQNKPVDNRIIFR